VKLGKAPTITLGEAAARYYETTLKPGGKPATLARDLGYLKRIKDTFGPIAGLVTSARANSRSGEMSS
jgi:hypothetical protein